MLFWYAKSDQPCNQVQSALRMHAEIAPLSGFYDNEFR